MSDTVKISANLAPEVVAALRDLAEKRGTSMTEVLRRAISMEKFIDDEIDRGGKLLVETADQEIKQVVRH